MAKLTYQRHPLSVSTNYVPIAIAATTVGSPTLIHTASTDIDEIWLDVYNYSLDSANLTILLGGPEASKQLKILVPSGRGLISAIKGLNFTGGVQVSAFASSATALSVVGYVNRLVMV